MKNIFKKWTLPVILSFLMIATIGWPLTSVTIKQHPEATDSVDVNAQKLMVVDAGYIHQIREGNIPGHDYVHIRGHSHSVGTADQELSALGTAGFGNWPVAAAGAVIVSTDAQDNAAGTGARSIIVRGFDDVGGSWVDVTTTIIPTGVAPTAASAQEFIRINEIEVVTAGTGLTNAGDITVSVGGTNIMLIYADHSTSDAGRRSVASNNEMHLGNIEASGIGNKEMTFHIFCRDTTVTNAAFQLRASWHSKDGGYRPDGGIEIFTEKVDMVIIAHSEIAGAKASGSAEGWTEEQ